nr:134_t:CDS:2 [Entrophospora candida]
MLKADSDKNIQDDPHSKIIEILRESSASSPSQTTDSQVKYARQFMEGELYSPQDLDEESYKTKRVGRFIRKTPNVDVFTKLNLDPLVEYKNFTLLSNFVSDMGRILPRSITGLSSKHQRKIAKAIKRARSFGLIPSTHRRHINKPDFKKN